MHSGEKAQGICPKCKDMIAATWYSDHEFAGFNVTERPLYVLVCDHCETIIELADRS